MARSRKSIKQQTVSDLGEWEIIRRLASGERISGPGLRYGIGDDTAVLARPRRDLLVTTDLIQEHIHFERAWAPWEHVGYKALQVNISDIAAMGGKPTFYWITVGLPARLSVRELKQLQIGLKRAAREENLVCAGGDTIRSPQGVCLGITLLGEAPQRVSYRNQAKPGDEIFVTGSVGEAGLGLALLKGVKNGWKESKRYCLRQTRPRARLKVGQRLVSAGLVHAMIDVSDGLNSDLGQLLKASEVGAQIMLDSLVPTPGFCHLCQRIGRDPYEFILGGGDDYELLFTASPRHNRSLARLSKRLHVPITKIGQIVSGRPIAYYYDAAGKKLQIKKLGFEHFK